MILPKATKLLTAQLHVLCLLLISQLAISTGEIISSEEIQKEPAERDLAGGWWAGYFNLRLFWQRGYRWQESSSEKYWCMSCDTKDCPENDSLEIKPCDRDEPRQQWYFDGLKIRSRGNKQMCLQRTGREIRLRRCSKSRYQRWSELPKNRPFELQMPGNSDKCVSQHHHPKENERIYMESCKLAVKADTDKWVVY